MANPSTQKTWQFNLNNYAPADSSRGSTEAHRNCRNALLGIKNALKGFLDQPWTHVASCDSATTSTASDLWVDFDDLVWRDDDTANPFSWIVLRQTGISATFELLITCEQDSNINDGSRIGAWVAQGGFTGGTTTTRPTASDERELRNSTSSGYWGSGPDGSTNDIVYHVAQSTDGQSTRVILYINGTNTGLWFFEKPTNTNAAWLDPYVASIQGNNSTTTDQATYAKYYDSPLAYTLCDGLPVNCYLSGEGFGSAAVGELIRVPDQLDGTFLASEMGLCSLSSTKVGRIGEVVDMWWGFSEEQSGKYFSSDGGSRAFVQIAHMIFPWDGSTLFRDR